MSSPPLDVLAVAAHPDDVELCLGGIVASAARKGLRVGILDLTNGEPTPRGTPERRLKEAEKARRILGAEVRVILDLPNRALRDTEEAREKVAAVLRRLRPKLVLSHWAEDFHPDHRAASAITEAACFMAKYTKTSIPGRPLRPPRMLFYPTYHRMMEIKVSVILDTSAAFATKIKALRTYKSQFVENPKSRKVFEKIEALNRYWGALIGRKYGEALISKEPVGLADLRSILLNP